MFVVIPFLIVLATGTVLIVEYLYFWHVNWGYKKNL